MAVTGDTEHPEKVLGYRSAIIHGGVVLVLAVLGLPSTVADDGVDIVGLYFVGALLLMGLPWSGLWLVLAFLPGESINLWTVLLWVTVLGSAVSNVLLRVVVIRRVRRGEPMPRSWVWFVAKVGF